MADVLPRYVRMAARAASGRSRRSATRTRQFAASRKLVGAHQRVLVFVKGDPVEATKAVGGEAGAAWTCALPEGEAYAKP